MFTLASGFYESYLVPPEVSILIIGLDNAGKTTLLERLKVTDLKNGSSPGKRISMKPIGRVDDSHKKVNRNSGSNCKDRSSDVGQNVIKIFDNDQEMKKTSAEDKKSHTLHKDEMVIAKSEINKSANVLCPSPKVYHLSRENDDALLESNELLSDPKTNKQDNNNGIVQLPPNTNHEGTTIMSPPTIVPSTTRDRQQNNGHQSKDRDIKHHELELEYDLKKGAKMLPSRLIRKTLGMNLAKFECKYAKVRLMDLGGSIQMRNIWEKYYNDVHGVM
jgi:GTPase SAR1 family protein